VNFKVGFQTDIGRKRQQNQDNGGAYPELGLFVVADGMGGHKGGEIASAMAVETVVAHVRAAEGQAPWDPRKVITEAIQKANFTIHERSTNEPQLHGMGTTTTALLFSQDLLTIGHVGDSRAYYFRKNAVWQITRDHSLVMEKLKAGLITRDQMKTDRMKNVITRSVGFEPQVSVEIYEMPVAVGDIFLICSDGLSGLIDDSKMLEVVQRDLFEIDDIRRAVEELVSSANESGGDDNITAIVVQVVA
jgi:serine/threonine protein phosphatase PrpC